MISRPVTSAQAFGVGFLRVVLLVTLGLATALPATAQWIAGSKVTVDAVDDGTRTVDITATIFYTTGVSFATAWLGVSSGYGTVAPAVDFGDGSTRPPYFATGNGIPFDQTSTPPGAPGPVRAYRMAFSHTYASDGIYPITVNSHFTGGISPALVFTGTTTTALTPSYATYGGQRTFVRNSASALIGGITPDDFDIPTVSETGLLVLALLLGGLGVFLLRR